MPPQVIDWADEFKEQFTNLVLKGREINSKHTDLTQVLAEIDNKRKLHATQHCLVCKSQNSVCPLDKEIKGDEQVAANLRSEGLTLSVEFKRLWADVNKRVVRYMVMEQVNEILRLRGIT
jgi:transcription elongation factor Elf1